MNIAVVKSLVARTSGRMFTLSIYSMYSIYYLPIILYFCFLIQRVVELKYNCIKYSTVHIYFSSSLLVILNTYIPI